MAGVDLAGENRPDAGTPADLDRIYHDRLYSGFAQRHFAKPAVRAFREHLVGRIVERLAVNRSHRLLSLGSGIGDTEILLASHAGEVVGIDHSPAASAQANRDAAGRGVTNFRSVHGSLPGAAAPLGQFDAIIAVFFLHHLSLTELHRMPAIVRSCLKPDGRFYSLDPNRRRLSGWLGEKLVPSLMARYQSPGEQPMDAKETAALFMNGGFDGHTSWYDFASTPVAGLFPSWRSGYAFARAVDGLLTAIPGINLLSSNFEITAVKR